MENTNKSGRFSRRDFIESGAATVAGIAVGATVGNVLPEDTPPETVKMLTADGKLVEVEKRHLPNMCAKPARVSNQAILEWMKDG